eukprot:TRINITY_DN2491_c0_g1_i1.p2 TRINITY_DN2491_c0_g1~~TRINITY_DN2491_c0_g1_i1.p2  ORF type:complete len:249 (+),score=49.20 TRINITY_DN2491_c0_g1_i1:47-793(+)
MRPSALRRPSLLALPSKQMWADEGRLSADILEVLVACNAHVATDYKRGDMRYDFVGRPGGATLTGLVRGAQKMCPKTWPAVMYLVDRAARRDLPLTGDTAVRMVAAAASLVLSTEGTECAAQLAHLASMDVTMLARLGERLIALLGDDADDEWDTLLGMDQIGWVRVELPRLARRLQLVFARRSSGAAKGVEPLHMALAPRAPPLPRQRSSSSATDLDCIGLSFSISFASSSSSSLLTEGRSLSLLDE